MTRSAILCAFVCFLLTACKQTPEFDPALLYGDWRGKEWLVAGKPSGREVKDVRFSFDAGMTYIAQYGEQKESGNYRIEGKKLYTTGSDKIEKVVKVVQISGDSLSLGMNRAGQEELLILVR